MLTGKQPDTGWLKVDTSHNDTGVSVFWLSRFEGFHTAYGLSQAQLETTGENSVFYQQPAMDDHGRATQTNLVFDRMDQDTATNSVIRSVLVDFHPVILTDDGHGQGYIGLNLSLAVSTPEISWDIRTSTIKLDLTPWVGAAVREIFTPTFNTRDSNSSVNRINVAAMWFVSWFSQTAHTPRVTATITYRYKPGNWTIYQYIVNGDWFSNFVDVFTTIGVTIQYPPPVYEIDGLSEGWSRISWGEVLGRLLDSNQGEREMIPLTPDRPEENDSS